MDAATGKRKRKANQKNQKKTKTLFSLRVFARLLGSDPLLDGGRKGLAIAKRDGRFLFEDEMGEGQDRRGQVIPDGRKSLLCVSSCL
jgi:hypothetical protein